MSCLSRGRPATADGFDTDALHRHRPPRADPAAGLRPRRLGDQRAKRLLITGDCLSGRQAEDSADRRRLGGWGLAVESCPADELYDRTEALVARMPVNQLMMAKLALNSALLAQARRRRGSSASSTTGSPGTPARATHSSSARPPWASMSRCASATSRTATMIVQFKG